MYFDKLCQKGATIEAELMINQKYMVFFLAEKRFQNLINNNFYSGKKWTLLNPAAIFLTTAQKSFLNSH